MGILNSQRFDCKALNRVLIHLKLVGRGLGQKLLSGDPCNTRGVSTQAEGELAQAIEKQGLVWSRGLYKTTIGTLDVFLTFQYRCKHILGIGVERHYLIPVVYASHDAQMSLSWLAWSPSIDQVGGEQRSGLIIELIVAGYQLDQAYLPFHHLLKPANTMVCGLFVLEELPHTLEECEVSGENTTDVVLMIAWHKGKCRYRGDPPDKVSRSDTTVHVSILEDESADHFLVRNGVGWDTKTYAYESEHVFAAWAEPCALQVWRILWWADILERARHINSAGPGNVVLNERSLPGAQEHGQLLFW